MEPDDQLIQDLAEILYLKESDWSRREQRHLRYDELPGDRQRYYRKEAVRFWPAITAFMRRQQQTEG